MCPYVPRCIHGPNSTTCSFCSFWIREKILGAHRFLELNFNYIIYRDYLIYLVFVFVFFIYIKYKIKIKKKNYGNDCGSEIDGRELVVDDVRSEK